MVYTQSSFLRYYIPLLNKHRRKGANPPHSYTIRPPRQLAISNSLIFSQLDFTVSYMDFNITIGQQRNNFPYPRTYYSTLHATFY